MKKIEDINTATNIEMYDKIREMIEIVNEIIVKLNQDVEKTNKKTAVKKGK